MTADVHLELITYYNFAKNSGRNSKFEKEQILTLVFIFNILEKNEGR